MDPQSKYIESNINYFNLCISAFSNRTMWMLNDHQMPKYRRTINEKYF